MLRFVVFDVGSLTVRDVNRTIDTCGTLVVFTVKVCCANDRVGTLILPMVNAWLGRSYVVVWDMCCIQ